MEEVCEDVYKSLEFLHHCTKDVSKLMQGYESAKFVTKHWLY